MNHSAYDYERIANAIQYLHDHMREQPSLDEVARHVHLSPFHFQRLFTEWAGVSPKQFLRFLTVEYAKKILSSEKQPSLFDAAEETGLSGTGRLHDLFVQIEGMTPGEYRNHGENLNINYSLRSCRFGNYLVASTPKGICNLYFFDSADDVLKELHAKWKNASLKEATDAHQESVVGFFSSNINDAGRIKLHLKGTDFQLKVWQALLKIPQGSLTTYGAIAGELNHPGASRAVGTAIGVNEIAYLIPCHRVIRSVGVIGEFRWGTLRKRTMLGWEAGMLYNFTGKAN